MIQRIEIPLDNGDKLVVEQSVDRIYPREVYVGIEDKHGMWLQDLAAVRQKYEINDGDLKYIKGRYEILVYDDENNEDYTHKFVINRHEEEEENKQ